MKKSELKNEIDNVKTSLESIRTTVIGLCGTVGRIELQVNRIDKEKDSVTNLYDNETQYEQIDKIISDVLPRLNSLTATHAHTIYNALKYYKIYLETKSNEK